MFKLIEELYNELTQKELMDVVHNMDNVLMIWWYRSTSGELIYFKDATSHDDERFRPFLTRGNDSELEKGRLLKYKNKVILLIYSAVSSKTSLSEDQLNDLINKVSEESGATISYVINHRGENLLEKARSNFMKRQTITERFTSTGNVLEANSSKLPQGVLCRAKYLICSCGQKNRNNRVYEKAVWDNVLADKEIQEKLNNRALFFHAEHPTASQSNTEKVAGIVTEIRVDESKNEVHAVMEVLDTPYGRIVDTLLRAGCGIGVSTRADGELEEAIDEAGVTYQRVIPESYKFVTVDFTADCSTYGSERPMEVERGVIGAIKQGVDDSKIDADFAVHLVETFESPEAMALVESLKHDQHHKSCKCKASDKKCLKGCKKVVIEKLDPDSQEVANISKKYGFGSVAWQDAMIARIKRKLEAKEQLSGIDTSFIETQLVHNKSLEIEELDKMWKANNANVPNESKVKESNSDIDYIFVRKDGQGNGWFLMELGFDGYERTISNDYPLGLYKTPEEAVKAGEKYASRDNVPFKGIVESKVKEETTQADGKLDQEHLKQVGAQSDAHHKKQEANEDYQDDTNKIHHGAVCSYCGKAVTEGEYGKGESNCCKAYVVPEEEYGKEVEESKVNEVSVDKHKDGSVSVYFKGEEWCAYPKDKVTGMSNDQIIDMAKKDHNKNEGVSSTGWTCDHCNKPNKYGKFYRVKDKSGKSKVYCAGCYTDVDPEGVYDKMRKEGLTDMPESKLQENIYKDIEIAVQDLVKGGSSDEEIVNQIKADYKDANPVAFDMLAGVIRQTREELKESVNEGLPSNFDINDASLRNSRHQCAICGRKLTGEGTKVFTDGSTISFDAKTFEGEGYEQITIGSECFKNVKESVNEVIKQVGSKWQVQSHKGKNLGTYDSKEGAEKRLKQVEYFKHKSESKEVDTNVYCQECGWKGDIWTVSLDQDDKLICPACKSFNVKWLGEPANESKVKCTKCGKVADKKQGASFKCVYCDGIEYRIVESDMSNLSDKDIVLRYKELVKDEHQELNKEVDALMKEIQKRGLEGEIMKIGESKYEIGEKEPGKTCPAGHKGLVRCKNKETGREMYSCDNCDKVYDLGEVDERVTYEYILWNTEEEMAKDVVKLGYKDVKDFVDSTGVTFADVKGKKFELSGNHVYTLGEKKVEEKAQVATIDKKVVDFLTDHWEEFLSADDAIKNIQDAYKLDVDTAKEYIGLVADGKGPIKDVKVKEQVDLAIVKAEKDKALEYATSLEARIKEMKENYIKDVLELQNSKNGLTESVTTLKERADKIEDLTIKLTESTKAVATLTEQIKSKDALLVEKHNAFEAANKEVITRDTKIKELTETHIKTLAELKEVHAKELLTTYTETRINSMGLKLPGNIRTLFESCKNRDEVEALIKVAKDMIREAALHSSKISEIVFHTPTDPVQREVMSRVGLAFTGMGQNIK